MLNSCLGLFSAASPRRRPFSRSYGAILPSSLAMLLPSALGFSPHPPVSVYGTGAHEAIAAFLGGCLPRFATFISLRFAALAFARGFSSVPPPPLAPVFPFPARVSPPRPRSSVHARYRNLHLLSIGYASPPRLRPRLPQGRSALPWNPWIFGREDSHLPLATHSGILPSYPSTAPSRTASSALRMLPYRCRKSLHPAASAACLSPGHFRRGDSRLVSCYALFECMAASEPTS